MSAPLLCSFQRRCVGADCGVLLCPLLIEVVYTIIYAHRSKYTLSTGGADMLLYSLSMCHFRSGGTVLVAGQTPRSKGRDGVDSEAGPLGKFSKDGRFGILYQNLPAVRTPFQACTGSGCLSPFQVFQRPVCFCNYRWSCRWIGGIATWGIAACSEQWRASRRAVA